MSLFYIDRVQTYSTVINKKCSELEDFVANSFSNVLTDRKGLAALEQEIRIKIKDLETKYPKSKQIRYGAVLSETEGSISACPDGNPEKTIFRLTYTAVKADYFPRGESGRYQLMPIIQEGGLK